MPTFIFYTLEGHTEAPDGRRVENCQLLGEACGEDASDALANLLSENRWIGEHGFSVGIGEIIARELSDTKRHLL